LFLGHVLLAAEQKQEMEEELKDDRNLARLDAGQYTLNLVAALLASIWGQEAPRQRAEMLFHQQVGKPSLCP
jgi:hypothetical protein